MNHGLDTDEMVCFYEQDFYVLSNFSAFRLHWRDWDFDTLEHAYHWERFYIQGEPNSEGYEKRLALRCKIEDARSAHEAFRLAQDNKQWQRPDWDEIKVATMSAMVSAKAEQHEYVARKLEQTGDRLLVENSWRDGFWGWGEDRKGRNELGNIWMLVRAERRARLQKSSEG